MLERLTGRAMIVTLCAVAALTLLGNLAVLSLPRVESAPDTYSLPGAVATLLGLFALVGAAIAWRQPRNGVGWIFLLAAAAGGIQGLAGNYGGYAIVERHRTLPGGDWAAWLAALALPFVVGPTTTLLILLFPDGRLPSPRWRPVFWFAFSALGVWAIALASLPGKFNSQQYTSNPLW